MGSSSEILNHQSAERIMGYRKLLYKQSKNYDSENTSKYRYNLCWVDSKDNFKFFTKCLDDLEMSVDEYWDPSEEDSGQVWKMLDVMSRMGYSIVLHNFTDFRIEVYFKGDYVLSNYCTDKLKRNQTIIESCLEALDRKKNGS